MPRVDYQNLLDKKFIASYLAEKIVDSRYKNTNWQNTKITPIKKIIGRFYHLVIRYDAEGVDQPIFCTAHSKEGRQQAYQALEYIDDHAFFKGKLTSLIPLFYDHKFRAMFYLGIAGKNLLDYIKKEPSKVKNLLRLAAAWVAEMHLIKADPKKHDFNPQSGRVETVVPGAQFYLEIIETKQQKFAPDIKKIFRTINEFDQENLEHNKKWLIHGDLHPENIIINSQDESEIAVIDYTDVCIGDFARDLGNFLLQLEYMTSRYNQELAREIPDLKKIFLDEYLRKRNLELNSELKKRIRMYLAWTAFRNAVFFLIKGFVEKSEAEKMIERAYHYLNQSKQIF